MMALSFDTSFALRAFKNFVSEVLVCKASALSGQDILLLDDKSQILAAIDEAEESGASPKQPQSLVATIQDRLSLCVQLESSQVLSGYGSDGLIYFKEASYLMAAYADEVFLNLDWPGRKQWENNLLEQRLFQTHVAGQKIFQDMDAYLATRDPSKRDLGALYLWILFLGFRGKFLKTPEAPAFLNYKTRLHDFVLGEGGLAPVGTHIFDEAYASTLRYGDSRKLPSTRLYNRVFFGVMGILVALSLAIFAREVNPLNQALDRILAYTSIGAEFR